MAKSIKISIDTAVYRIPTEEDILAAKDFILQREECAVLLGGRVDEILASAAERIVLICYRYNFDPKRLFFSSAFNQGMMDEISAVMDEV